MVRELSMMIMTKGESMNRYYVELRQSLKQKYSIGFYIMAYNRSHIVDMFRDEYRFVTSHIVTPNITE